MPACRLCTHAYLLTELPTDLLGLVTYCHHSIGDDLPPPVVMCAAMLCDMDMRHGSSRHGCKPQERLQPYAASGVCTVRRGVMALATAATWPVRAAKGKKLVTKKKK